jgi:solute carrier family 13 (sodium-dependent dicarboxylate transporter), member 2/3/5
VKSQTGRELTYLGWLQFGVPVLLIGVPLAWAAVTLVVFQFRLPTLDVASIAVALGDDRSLRVPRRRLLLIIAATVLAWVAMPLVRKVVPGASDGGVATLAALALFVTPSGGIGRTPMLDWEDARRIPWGVLVMVAGSLAIAAAVTETGLGAWLAAPLREIGGVPPGLALAALVVGVAVATELLSNFALVAIAVPAATALAGALRIDPVPLVIGATMAAAGGYVVPGPPWLSVAASTPPARARDLARAGPLVLLLTASLISIVGWLLS